MQAPPSPIRRTHLIEYSVLALPLAMAGLPIYLHAPEFYASEFGIPLTTLGLVLLALRVIDAVQDPFIGSISDHLHHHRRLILLGGMVLLALGFWLVFNPNGSHPVPWFALGILLCTTGFSVVNINFLALGSLWQATTTGRTRITSWREACGLVGLLLASITPALLGSSDDAQQAFSRLALLYMPLLVLTGLLFFRWHSQAIIHAPIPQARPPSFARLLNWWNMNFFGIYICNVLAGSIPAVLVIFFINDLLGAEALVGLFLLLYFVAGVMGMPLWQWLAKKIGKERAWLASMLLAVASFAWAYTLGTGDVMAYAVICMLSGLALGADLALPPSIAADQIAKCSDQDVATRYFSIMTFLTKAALALATGITLPILGLLGYQPGNVGEREVASHLSQAYALVPSLLKVGVAAWLWYFISRDKQGERNNENKDCAGGYAHVS